MDRAPEPGELSADGVDEERHVVRDDLDDGVPGRPAVFLDGRAERPDVGAALGPLRGQATVRHGGAVEVDRVSVDQVLGGDVPVVAVQEAGVVSAGGAPGPGVLPHLGGTRQQVALGLVQLVQHDRWLPSRSVPRAVA